MYTPQSTEEPQSQSRACPKGPSVVRSPLENSGNLQHYVRIRIISTNYEMTQQIQDQQDPAERAIGRCRNATRRYIGGLEIKLLSGLNACIRRGHRFNDADCLQFSHSRGEFDAHFNDKVRQGRAADDPETFATLGQTFRKRT